MPELTIEASHKYWKQYHDPMIYKVVSFMESVETWVRSDFSQLEAAIEELGRQLDDIGKINIDELNQQESFIRLINNTNMPRALRLLQALDIANPGAASKLLMHAEEISKHTKDDASLFLQRNIVFERLRLLGRVFSSSRLMLVLKSIEGE